MKKYWIALSVAVAIVVAIAVYHYTVANPSAGDQAASSDVTSPAQPAVTPTAEPSEQSRQSQFNYGSPLQDTSILKPPPGAKVAIIVFEDMECPACAHAFPLVHAAAARYKIPLVRHDYPWQFHVWSLDAAVTARYIQDNLSPQLADDFRRDVFANQTLIASKDDLTRFTTRWFQSHGKTLPFVMDANGACRNEVESDRALGDRLGVKSTPCIIVVTQSQWLPVANPDQLDLVIDGALAQTAASTRSPSERPAVLLRPAPARS
jgi:protein-disulfide isomerase